MAGVENCRPHWPLLSLVTSSSITLLLPLVLEDEVGGQKYLHPVRLYLAMQNYMRQERDTGLFCVFFVFKQDICILYNIELPV